MAMDITFTGVMYVYYFIWALLGGVAGFWIYRDAKGLPALFLNSKPIWWFFASLISGPVWVLFAYWLIHHSTISNRINSNDKNT